MVGTIKVKTIKKLFALSGNRCAYPNCGAPVMHGSTVVAEICHIHAVNPGGARFADAMSEEERNDALNLLLLCPTHHKLVDDRPDLYDADRLFFIKSEHEHRFGRLERPEDMNLAKLIELANSPVSVVNPRGHVAINSPGTIQANTIKFGNSSRIVVSPPSGMIGENKYFSRYIERLIKRYNEFASADKIQGRKFSYGALSKNIEHLFGTKWQFLDIKKFDELCMYLQRRIDKTILAKRNASKGQKSYSTYSEYLEKYGADGQD